MKRLMMTSVLALSILGQPLSANEFSAQLLELAGGPLSAIATDPAVIAAIRVQNELTGGLNEAEIITLDNQWRAEVEARGDLIEGLLSRPLSEHLRTLQIESGGLYAEMFVMDFVGLNVAQSEITSDYWQGDEEKHSVPLATSAPHISEVELDESSQSWNSQVSLPIFDPETSLFIGAITVGVNIEMLVN